MFSINLELGAGRLPGWKSGQSAVHPKLIADFRSFGFFCHDVPNLSMAPPQQQFRREAQPWQVLVQLAQAQFARFLPE